MRVVAGGRLLAAPAGRAPRRRPDRAVRCGGRADDDGTVRGARRGRRDHGGPLPGGGRAHAAALHARDARLLGPIPGQTRRGDPALRHVGRHRPSRRDLLGTPRGRGPGRVRPGGAVTGVPDAARRRRRAPRHRLRRQRPDRRRRVRQHGGRGRPPRGGRPRAGLSRHDGRLRRAGPRHPRRRRGGQHRRRPRGHRRRRTDLDAARLWSTCATCSTSWPRTRRTLSGPLVLDRRLDRPPPGSTRGR